MRAGDVVTVICQVLEADEESYTVAIQATVFAEGNVQQGRTVTDIGVVVQAGR